MSSRFFFSSLFHEKYPFYFSYSPLFFLYTLSLFLTYCFSVLVGGIDPLLFCRHIFCSFLHLSLSYFHLLFLAFSLPFLYDCISFSLSSIFVLHPLIFFILFSLCLHFYSFQNSLPHR